MESGSIEKPALLNRVVVISALGYFVDIYDVILFRIVHQKSLVDIGIAESDILSVGFKLQDYLTAVIIGEYLSWRWAYGIGSVLALLLLILRMQTGESEFFAKVVSSGRASKRAFFSFFTGRDLFRRYISCIDLGIPVWLVVGVSATRAPDFAKARRVAFQVHASTAAMSVYSGLAIGDLTSGALTHYAGSRKKVIGVFMLAAFVFLMLHIAIGACSQFLFYGTLTLLGFAIEYWALFVLPTAGYFGTNLRASATTTVPNFARGSLVSLNFIVATFAAARQIMTGAWVAFACSFPALFPLRETHGVDLDFVEGKEALT